MSATPAQPEEAATARAQQGGEYGQPMVLDLTHAPQKVRMRMVFGAAQLVGAVMLALPAVFAVTYDGVAPHAAALAGASLLLVATALAANLSERHKLNVALVIAGAAGMALIAAALTTVAALAVIDVADMAKMFVWVAAVLAGASLLIRFLYTIARVAGLGDHADDGTALHRAASEFAAYVPFARPLYNQGFAGFARRQAHRLEESAERLPNRV